MMWPELVRKLAVWTIVGGTYSTMSLAGVYVMNELRTVRSGGIEGVLEMAGPAGSWADLIAANPRNRDRLLAIGTEEFERVMNRWLDAFIPKPNEPIPGRERLGVRADQRPDADRPGRGEGLRPSRSGLRWRVHSLIKGSRLIEPPWPEDAWERGSEAQAAGTGNLFGFWVLGAPVLLDFINET